MTDDDLDRAYTALCHALARAGEAQAPLFLSMLSLSLMSRLGSASDVLTLIEQVQARLAAQASHG